jgi:hypothetical protein
VVGIHLGVEIITPLLQFFLTVLVSDWMPWIVTSEGIPVFVAEDDNFNLEGRGIPVCAPKAMSLLVLVSRALRCRVDWAPEPKWVLQAPTADADDSSPANPAQPLVQPPEVVSEPETTAQASSKKFDLSQYGDLNDLETFGSMKVKLELTPQEFKIFNRGLNSATPPNEMEICAVRFFQSYRTRYTAIKQA